jgi:hypothetical protein
MPSSSSSPSPSLLFQLTVIKNKLDSLCVCGSREVVNGTILATLTIREKAIVNNIVAIACVIDLWLATYEPVFSNKTFIERLWVE